MAPSVGYEGRSASEMIGSASWASNVAIRSSASSSVPSWKRIPLPQLQLPRRAVADLGERLGQVGHPVALGVPVGDGLHHRVGHYVGRHGEVVGGRVQAVGLGFDGDPQRAPALGLHLGGRGGGLLRTVSTGATIALVALAVVALAVGVGGVGIGGVGRAVAVACVRGGRVGSVRRSAHAVAVVFVSAAAGSGREREGQQQGQPSPSEPSPAGLSPAVPGRSVLGPAVPSSAGRSRAELIGHLFNPSFWSRQS